MMKRAIATLIENGDITYEEFIRMDDIDLIHKLRTSDGYPRDIMSRIDRRDLFKIIFQERLELIDENFRKNLAIDKDKIEEKIREDFGIENGYLLLDIPDTKLSEFRIKVEFDNELKRIDEVSSLARALEKAEMEKLTICIYTSRENIKKFKDFNPERYIELSQTRLNKFISVR